MDEDDGFEAGSVRPVHLLLLEVGHISHGAHPFACASRAVCGGRGDVLPQARVCLRAMAKAMPLLNAGTGCGPHGAGPWPVGDAECSHGLRSATRTGPQTRGLSGPALQWSR